MRDSVLIDVPSKWIVACGLMAILLIPNAVDAQHPDQVRAALHRAVEFFRGRVSVEGGYVYQWSEDLSKREGEGKVGAGTAWIEPPGTPAVGMAYLDAYRRCGEPILLEAAKETAGALVRGQLVSGGWDNRIEFGSSERKQYAYRVDSKENQVTSDRRRKTTTFDDDKSQSAARFLLQLDQQLEFKDPVIHEASTFALDCFVRAQYANGAWPQRYSEFPSTTRHQPKQASIDPDWSRVFPGAKYAEFYTLNDNTISDLIVTMLDAWDVYQKQSYRDAAVRGGDFLLLAQLPEPQPGWAQQYNQDMHPAWARKFEPPAVSGGESQGVMRTLILLYRRASRFDPKADRFLEPLPRALAYYRRSLRADGRLARFYELETNRPLFFNRQYELTYSSDDMPTHYAFLVGSGLDKIEKEFNDVRRLPEDQLWKPKPVTAPSRTPQLNRKVLAILDELDARGAWVEPGRLRYHGDDDSTERVIRSRTFITNLSLLASWLGKDR